jgi:hypothetical protein
MFNISNEAIQINERFFYALDTLKHNGEISGIYGFAQKYNVVLGNLYTIKSQKKGAVKAEYLTYLVRDFGISAQWLLTGEGGMFKQKPSRT